MPSHHKDSSPCPSTSPRRSALPTPPPSFPVHSIEQIDRPELLEELGMSSETLSDLHRKFNRVEFNIMNDTRFEELVLESVKDRHAKNLYQKEDIEAEIKQRMDDVMTKLHNDTHTSKYTMLPKVFKAVPEDKQLTFHLIRLLAANNIYDIESFVAYGIGPLLEYVKPNATEEVDNTQTSRKNTPVSQMQLRTTRKLRPRSVKASGTSSSTDSSRQKPTLTNIRRSSRLRRQHAQRHGIRKTYIRNKNRKPDSASIDISSSNASLPQT
ncbi:MAG: hypothetical protein M1834_006560 [Cirrosporium novae-zelandiae]|nr:MAG: hypothetical protein M1834_006560 [Cirrosporium novae-zelandiae]